MQFSIYALSTFLIVTPVLVSAMPTTLDISSRNPKSIFTEIGDDLNDFGNSFQDSVVEFYETVVTGCKVVQCAEAISPTVLTCVVDAISNNPLGCLTAVVADIKTGETACDGCAQAVATAIAGAV